MSTLALRRPRRRSKRRAIGRRGRRRGGWSVRQRRRLGYCGCRDVCCSSEPIESLCHTPNIRVVQKIRFERTICTVVDQEKETVILIWYNKVATGLWTGMISQTSVRVARSCRLNWTLGATSMKVLARAHALVLSRAIRARIWKPSQAVVFNATIVSAGFFLLLKHTVVHRM